jgi:hypothetical protein
MPDHRAERALELTMVVKRLPARLPVWVAASSAELLPTILTRDIPWLATVVGGYRFSEHCSTRKKGCACQVPIR